MLRVFCGDFMMKGPCCEEWSGERVQCHVMERGREEKPVLGSRDEGSKGERKQRRREATELRRKAERSDGERQRDKGKKR